jgi:hypothetical protein
MVIRAAEKQFQTKPEAAFPLRPRVRHRISHRLTVNAVKLQRAPGKYSDGNGLRLAVDAPNRRYWPLLSVGTARL